MSTETPPGELGYLACCVCGEPLEDQLWWPPYLPEEDMPAQYCNRHRPERTADGPETS